GTGNDIYILDVATDVISETSTVATEIDTVLSSVSYTLGANLENLTLTGTTTINGTGNTLNNFIIGNSADNSLDGGDGNDTLDGGGGNDTLIGGTGNDVYIVNSTTVVNETSTVATEIDTVLSSVTYTLGANLENLILTGTTAINGTGNTLNNYLTGNIGNNTLDGGDGNDTLDGGIGVDSLVGGTGNDVYIVDSTTDVVTETSTTATEIDTVLSSVTYTLSANVENLSLTGTTAINGTGNTLDNVITGNSAKNTLNGGAGNDTLNGGGTEITLLTDNFNTENGGSATSNYNNFVNWSVTDGAVDLFGPGFGDFLPGNGLYLDLDGSISNGGRLESKQTFSFSAGDVITLQFSLAGSQQGNTNSATVSLGSLFTETFTRSSDAPFATITRTINVTANSTGKLIFDQAGGDNEGLLLDNVSIKKINGDSLVGGTGNDFYIVNNALDIVSETSTVSTEIDTVQSSVNYTLTANVENLILVGSAINGTGNTLANQITGNSAANTLDGGAGNDTLDGGAGNDTLIGGTGADTLIGGLGNDTYTVDNSGDVVTETSTLATEIDTVQSSITYTLGDNLENLTLTGTANINGTGNTVNNVITGNDGNNTLNGGDGVDTLNGGAGNDTLNGGVGADSLIGGLGNDIYIVDNTGEKISETSTLATEIDTVQSSVTWTLGANVENLTLTGNDTINGTGNSLNNVIIGNGVANNLNGSSGNDSLDGGAGNDTLIGGDGNDTLLGGTGNDSLVGGTGNDIYVIDITTDLVSETSTTTTEIDTVLSSVTWTLGANLENLTLTGSSIINGTGNSLNNVIIGNGVANTLSGGAGNDSLDGGAGNDSLDGGAGNDILNGGVGNDTLIGGVGNDFYIVDSTTDVVTETSTTATEIDTVESSATYSLSANLENLTLTGISAINGTGNGLPNLIIGSAGDNILTGGAGIDTLIGGNGGDRLVGGEGNDILNLGLGDAVIDTVIYNPGDDSDTVNEFAFGSDKFAVVGLTSVDVVTSGADTQFRLGNGTAGDAGFGTGSLLFTITGVNTFNTGNIASSVDASNTANFFFS
ncbi:beta strand repeat-containing protein, partial [Geminocystis sp. GBBB08]|uniref:beta strand repeat-containing protein n=1 Tax=Geminocystis sp. GBBB08 TaxID=2604140 RepID=UPI0029287FF2|nr:rhizobiocin [Geminocystis sp. GBBB08]